jgi:RNA recognition motif-containing protein
MGKKAKLAPTEHKPAPQSKGLATPAKAPSASVLSSSEIVRSIRRRVVVEETDGSEEEVLIVKVSRTPSKVTPAKAPEPQRKVSSEGDLSKKAVVKKPVLDSSSSSESDAPAVKAPPTQKKLLQSSSSSDEATTKLAPKAAVKPAVAKPAPVAKAPVKKQIESSESSDDDLPVKPVGKKTTPTLKKQVISDSSSDDLPVVKKPTAASKAKKVSSSSSDSDAPVFTTKKPVPKPADSDDSVSEEDAKAVKGRKAPVVLESSEEESSDDEPKLGTKRKASSSSDDSVEKKPKIAPQTAARQQAPTQAFKPQVQAAEGDIPEIFVGGLAWAATEDDVYTLFSPYGTVENVKLLYNEQGQSRGNGFVKFSSPSEAAAALAANGTEHLGRAIRVNMAGDKPPTRAPGEPSGNTVFVKNLSYTISEEAIESFFTSCGQLKQVRLAKDFEGNSKGFAHVEFVTQKSAEAAVQLTGQKLEGRPVTVDFAKARTEGTAPPRGGPGQRQGPGGARAAPSGNFTGKKIVL